MMATLKKNKKMLTLVIVLIVMMVAIFSVYAIMLSGGEEAPAFTLTDIDGNTFSLSDYEGKVVVIDFMATWCPDCNDVMPNLVKVHEKYKDDIVMISIDVDNGETDKELRDFKDKYGAQWRFAFDSDDLMHKYSTLNIPKLVIIDGDGGVTFTDVGVVSEEELYGEIEKALSGDAALTSLGTTSLGLIGLAIGVGVGSFFSPCSFPLLPGYMSFYLGMDKSRSIRRALMGGGAAALGLVLVYLLIGIVVAMGGTAIKPYIPLMEPIVGVIIVIMGVVLLTNYSIPVHRISEPLKKIFSRKRTTGATSDSMSEEKRGYLKLFGYGVGYAGAAAGCTAPLLLALIFGAMSSGGFLKAFLIFVICAAVMAVLMIFVTIMIAMSAGTLLQKLKVSTAWIKRISGIILIVVGVYLVGYYSVVFG